MTFLGAFGPGTEAPAGGCRIHFPYIYIYIYPQLIDRTLMQFMTRDIAIDQNNSLTQRVNLNPSSR